MSQGSLKTEGESLSYKTMLKEQHRDGEFYSIHLFKEAMYAIMSWGLSFGLSRGFGKRVRAVGNNDKIIVILSFFKIF